MREVVDVATINRHFDQLEDFYREHRVDMREMAQLVAQISRQLETLDDKLARMAALPSSTSTVSED